MIIDRLRNVALYGALPENIRGGLAFLAEHDLTRAEPGKVEIDGERLFAIIQEYDTKPPGTGKWEAHRRYWDLQYMVRGTEHLLYAPVDQLRAGEYVPEKDFLPLEGDGDRITLRQGMVAVLSPQDAHMPGMAIGPSEQVRKVVVKVAV